MLLDETTVHIVGGGIAGMVGAVITCPLELIKVRFQSSQWNKLSKPFPPPVSPTRRQTNFVQKRISSTHPQGSPLTGPTASLFWRSSANSNDVGVVLEHITKCEPSHHYAAEVHQFYISSTANHARPTFSRGFHCPQASNTLNQRSNPLFRSKIILSMAEVGRTEGYRALFKGLIPTLVGALPHRAIYFCAYHEGQQFFQPFFSEGHSLVYLLSAGFGSITASTATCPIWYIKTRLQLDSRPCSKPVTVGQVIRTTWKKMGVRGFYRGLSASYVGSTETALNFVIYENVKGVLLDHGRYDLNAAVEINRNGGNVNYRGTVGGSKLATLSDTALCMVASAFSKFVAITITYPHEVARTRMREPDKMYRTFVGTLRKVAREEGLEGLYRGLGTHYIRQVPNTCLVMGTYEGIVYLLDSWDLIRHKSAIYIA